MWLFAVKVILYLVTAHTAKRTAGLPLKHPTSYSKSFCTSAVSDSSDRTGAATCLNRRHLLETRLVSKTNGKHGGRQPSWAVETTYPSTAGERSGLLLPLDLYLLWLPKRGGRPCPQESLDPSRPPMDPPRPVGTDPPIDPPPSPPRSPKPIRRPPGSRCSESGLSLSVVNGRSSNKRCHSYKDVNREGLV